MLLKSKLKIFILTLLLTWSVAVIPAYAQQGTPPFDQPAATSCYNPKNPGDKNTFYGKFQLTLPGVGQVNTLGGLPVVCSAGSLIASVITLLLQFSGLVAVVFLMLGGFWYLTAAGNEEQSEKGRKALTSAIIGLVVIVMAYALVRITANLLTSGLSGGNGGTTPAATTPAPATTNPGGGNNPPAGSGADQYGLTQQDFADNYNHTNRTSEVLASIQTGFNFGGASGVTASSNIPASNKAGLVELESMCGGKFPPTFVAKLGYADGTKQDYQSTVYQKGTAGDFSAAINSNAPLNPAATTLEIWICNVQIKIDTIPAGARG